MRKININTFIAVLLSCLVVLLTGINMCFSNKIEKYVEYYEATETLLDTLEYHDNWVDRFDPIDYYEAREALK